MYPHERSLVEEYQGRPFALLGVNSDNPQMLAEIEAAMELSWRSFAAGSGGGQIARDWQISGWPTIILIDDRGVIRARDVPEMHLDMGIDALVREAEARQEKVGT